MKTRLYLPDESWRSVKKRVVLEKRGDIGAILQELAQKIPEPRVVMDV
jgi:signal recognition particle subunit SEC65